MSRIFFRRRIENSLCRCLATLREVSFGASRIMPADWAKIRHDIWDLRLFRNCSETPLPRHRNVHSLKVPIQFPSFAVRSPSSGAHVPFATFCRVEHLNAFLFSAIRNLSTDGRWPRIPIRNYAKCRARPKIAFIVYNSIMVIVIWMYNAQSVLYYTAIPHLM